MIEILLALAAGVALGILGTAIAAPRETRVILDPGATLAIRQLTTVIRRLDDEQMPSVRLPDVDPEATQPMPGGGQ